MLTRRATNERMGVSMNSVLAGFQIWLPFSQNWTYGFISISNWLEIFSSRLRSYDVVKLILAV